MKSTISELMLGQDVWGLDRWSHKKGLMPLKYVYGSVASVVYMTMGL